jgi:hypothetical protein
MSIINPIGPGPADASRLTEIRHAKLSFSHGADGLQFFYVGKIKKTPGNDIKGYIRDIAKHSAELAGERCHGKSLVGDETSPLDLNSEVPCYFVLELDAQHNWQFQHDGPAITGKTHLHDKYCELRHVHKGSGHDPADGCKLIYFAAIDPPGKEKPGKHPFNFHVEFLQAGGKRLPIIIDPDIRWPGGHTS